MFGGKAHSLLALYILICSSKIGSRTLSLCSKGLWSLFSTHAQQYSGKPGDQSRTKSLRCVDQRQGQSRNIMAATERKNRQKVRSFSELRLRKAVHRKSISIRLHVLTSKGEVVKWERCRIHRDMAVFHNFSQVKPVLGNANEKTLNFAQDATRNAT